MDLDGPTLVPSSLAYSLNAISRGSLASMKSQSPGTRLLSEQGYGGSQAVTSDTRLSRKAAAFVEWLSAGGDGVCTT